MVAIFQGNEVLIVGVLLLLLFGGTQIPRLARSLGQAQKEFKDGLKEGADDEELAEGESKADDSSKA